MPFPDSSKKAPNVFVEINDGTGSPSAASSSVKSTTTKVINVTPTPPPPLSCPLPSWLEDQYTIDLWHFDEGIGATNIAATIYYGFFPPLDFLGGSFVLGPAQTNCGTALYTGDQFNSYELQLLEPPMLFPPG